MRLGLSLVSGKEAIKNWIKANIQENATILDVGAGQGTYADLLNDCSYIIDALEVYDKAIVEIINKYHSVFYMDIRDFQFFKNYDLVIFGDVLEHLNITDAQQVLHQALQYSKWVLVAVPFDYPQGPTEDNPAEEHLQPDLNIRTMQERYPMLDLLLYICNKTELVYLEDNSPYTLYYAYYIAKGALYNE